ncbi:MAG: hypothetical protein AAGM38_06770 [Pseudomonadota bacterium]
MANDLINNAILESAIEETLENQTPAQAQSQSAPANSLLAAAIDETYENETTEEADLSTLYGRTADVAGLTAPTDQAAFDLYSDGVNADGDPVSTHGEGSAGRLAANAGAQNSVGVPLNAPSVQAADASTGVAAANDATLPDETLIAIGGGVIGESGGEGVGGLIVGIFGAALFWVQTEVGDFLQGAEARLYVQQ